MDALLTLFPNPTGDAFQMKTNLWAAQAAAVEMIDPMGRLVRHWKPEERSFSVQGVAPGPYIVRVVGRAGGTLAQGRLIVQH